MLKFNFNLSLVSATCLINMHIAHLSTLDTVLHTAHLHFFVCTPEISSKTAILSIQDCGSDGMPSVAKPARPLCYANLNHYHYSFL